MEQVEDRDFMIETINGYPGVAFVVDRVSSMSGVPFYKFEGEDDKVHLLRGFQNYMETLVKMGVRMRVMDFEAMIMFQGYGELKSVRWEMLDGN